MNILWLAWKDHAHPAAGGAEVVKEQLAKRLAQHGHTVIILTARYPGSAHKSAYQGYTIVRVGNKLTVYWRAYRYYKKHLQKWPNVIIDECNTLPFFAKFYAKQPVVMFIHQLARQVWFSELPLPFSAVGWALEPLYLRILSSLPAITVSNSSRKDLRRHGFKNSAIHIIPEGLAMQPISGLHAAHKAQHPTLLVHGAVRRMKRTLHAVKAYEQATHHVPNLHLIVSGKSFGRYGKKVANYIATSPHRHNITHYGQVTEATKKTIMRKSHFIVVTSTKEGWGLIVSEAAAQGTPAIVYNVDGLRDAVGGGAYGLLSRPNPYSLNLSIQKAFSTQTNYKNLQTSAYNFAKNLTFLRSFYAFNQVLEHVGSQNKQNNTTY